MMISPSDLLLLVLLLSTREILGQNMMYPVKVSTVCQPSGTAPVPTDAVGLNAGAQYKSGSSIMCAAITNFEKGLAYVYQHGICTIYGSGLGTGNVDYFATAIEILPSVEEVAHAKPTYASHPNTVYLKEMVVDGIIAHGNMYHGPYVPDGWWMVDLEGSRRIHQIIIFTRTDCCSQRFHDIEVRVGSTLRTDGNFSSHMLMSTYEGPYDVSQGHLICTHLHGAQGRYVSIKMVSSVSDNLQLNEVYVYAKTLT